MSSFPDMSAGRFLGLLYQRIAKNAATDRAAQLSYYFLFALFPFLFFLVTLAAYLPLQGALQDLFARIDPFLPAQAMEIIRIRLTALTTDQRPHLLTFGLALALWSASRGVDALRTSLNLSYAVKESRPWWKAQGIALLITVCTSGLMLLTWLYLTGLIFIVGGEINALLEHESTEGKAPGERVAGETVRRRFWQGFRPA